LEYLPPAGVERASDSTGKDGRSVAGGAKSGAIDDEAARDPLSRLLTLWPSLGLNAQIALLRIAERVVASVEVDDACEIAGDAPQDRPGCAIDLRGTARMAPESSEGLETLRLGLRVSDDERRINVPAPVVVPSTSRRKRDER